MQIFFLSKICKKKMSGAVGFLVVFRVLVFRALSFSLAPFIFFFSFLLTLLSLFFLITVISVLSIVHVSLYCGKDITVILFFPR
jgi:hypothetical protein